MDLKSILLWAPCTALILTLFACEHKKTDTGHPIYGELKFIGTTEDDILTSTNVLRGGSYLFDEVGSTDNDAVYVDILLKKDPQEGTINLGDSARVIVHSGSTDRYFNKPGEKLTYTLDIALQEYEFTFDSLTETNSLGQPITGGHSLDGYLYKAKEQ